MVPSQWIQPGRGTHTHTTWRVKAGISDSYFVSCDPRCHIHPGPGLPASTTAPWRLTVCAPVRAGSSAWPHLSRTEPPRLLKVSWNLDGHLCGTQTRTDKGWTQRVGSSQAHPEHSWRRANRPCKKIWQLEPLFLVFFLKSIIRNFQYRNNPSKPFKSVVV